MTDEALRLENVCKDFGGRTKGAGVFGPLTMCR